MTLYKNVALTNVDKRSHFFHSLKIRCHTLTKVCIYTFYPFIEEKKIIYCITMAFESHFYNIQVLALLSTLSTFKYMPFSFLKNCTLIR